jgi:hypothetical protein
MFFYEVNFAARWFGLAALVTLGLPAAAQQTIQISKPVDTDPSSKANAFMPEAARRNPDSFNAPSPLFGGTPDASFDVLPGSPPPVFYNANPQQWQKFLDNKKNWTLMTPEEVLGIPTPEKILGVTDPDDDPSLSADERFLKRQDQQAAMAVTNGLRGADSLLWQKDNSPGRFFQTADQEMPFARLMAGSVPDANRNLGSPFSPHPGQPADAAEKLNSAWASPFITAEQPAKLTPEQLADRESFRALLDPPTEDKTPSTSGLFAQPAIPVDPNMEPVPASFNPAGRSFTGLQNDVGHPTGITPLPGVTGPLPQPKKVAPLVQPPPWMQDPLQSSTMPQRQF